MNINRITIGCWAIVKGRHPSHHIHDGDGGKAPHEGVEGEGGITVHAGVIKLPTEGFVVVSLWFPARPWDPVGQGRRAASNTVHMLNHSYCPCVAH